MDFCVDVFWHCACCDLVYLRTVDLTKTTQSSIGQQHLERHLGAAIQYFHIDELNLHLRAWG
jgi:hypothetical protein